jgi:hypothetical protein
MTLRATSYQRIKVVPRALTIGAVREDLTQLPREQPDSTIKAGCCPLPTSPADVSLTYIEVLFRTRCRGSQCHEMQASELDEQHAPAPQRFFQLVK